MAVIDLREDPRTDLAIAGQIGGAVGGAIGKHFQQKLRKNTQEDFVRFMSDGVAAGKSVEELHRDFPTVRRNAHARTLVEQDQEFRQNERARQEQESRIQSRNQQILIGATNQVSKLRQDKAEYLTSVELTGEVDPKLVEAFDTQIADWQRRVQSISRSVQPGQQPTPQAVDENRLRGLDQSNLAGIDTEIGQRQIAQAPASKAAAEVPAAAPTQTTRELHRDVDSGLLGEVDLLTGRGQEAAAAAPLSKTDQEIAAVVAEVPKIKDDAEFDALPSGTVFIDPEGNRRRKP